MNRQAQKFSNRAEALYRRLEAAQADLRNLDPDMRAPRAGRLRSLSAALTPILKSLESEINSNHGSEPT